MLVSLDGTGMFQRRTAYTRGPTDATDDSDRINSEGCDRTNCRGKRHTPQSLKMSFPCLSPCILWVCCHHLAVCLSGSVRSLHASHAGTRSSPLTNTAHQWEDLDQSLKKLFHTFRKHLVQEARQTCDLFLTFMSKLS